MLPFLSYRTPILYYTMCGTVVPACMHACTLAALSLHPRRACSLAIFTVTAAVDVVACRRAAAAAAVRAPVSLRAGVVGCIRVHLFDTALLLRAAKNYPVDEDGRSGEEGGGRAFLDEDPLAHITNTARQAEDETFREEDK